MRAVLSANVIPASTFDLAIHGTDIQYSPLGLPSAMGGDIYLAVNGAATHASIGHYQEALTPILMDINGDQVPDFVGTQGVATFTFYIGNSQHVLGTITTADVSYIQGVTPAGQMLVGSQGTIVSANSTTPLLLFRGLAGGFASQSTVGLGPTFAMQTNVHFTVNRPVGPALTVVAFANDLVSAANTPSGQWAVDTVLTVNNHGSDAGNHHGDAPGGDDAHHGSDLVHDSKLSGDAHDSHDGVFSDDTDWLTGNGHSHALLS